MRVTLAEISRSTPEKPQDMSAEVMYSISIEAEDFPESLVFEALQNKDVRVDVMGLGVFYRKGEGEGKE